MSMMSTLFGRSEDGGHIDTAVQTWDFITQSLCIAGMTICFALRVYTRIFMLKSFNREDWMCATAWFLGVCYSIIALIMGHYGGGLHIDDVPPENLIPFGKTVYVTMVMYGPTAFITKVCLLWIMTRVFSPFRKTVIFIYAFMAVMLGYYIPAVIVKIRICDPISRFWDRSVHGTCLDETSIILADAVVSVVSDLIILIMPLPLTMSLQMANKKKIRVMGLLGAGGLAVTATIIRLALIVTTGQSKDSTFAFMRINMLGNAEIAMGVICTCLPALSALLIRVYHEYSSNKATSDYKMSTMQNQQQSKTQRSKVQMSVRDLESDEDVLMYNVQGNPRIETTIHGDTERQVNSGNSPFEGNGIGITRTVDVSTSVETRP